MTQTYSMNLLTYKLLNKLRTKNLKNLAYGLFPIDSLLTSQKPIL